MSCWQRKISLGSIEGPLSAILESYATALNEERYSHESFLSKTWFVIGFSRWLHRKRIMMPEVTRGVGQRFLRDKPRRSGDPVTLTHFLAWMHSRGLISAEALLGVMRSRKSTRWSMSTQYIC